VDPGAVELRIGASSADIRATVGFVLDGPRREVGFDRTLVAEIA
jgi:beta-glucosidase